MIHCQSHISVTALARDFVLRYKENETIILLMSVGKPKGKRRLGKDMHWWEYNIKINLKEMRVEAVYCIFVI
jgi:hypothetical protein